MIVLESKENERALFENQEEAIIPIEITERDGEVEIITLERTLDVAKELEKRFSKNLFSDEAIAFIHNSLKRRVDEWGYTVDDLKEGYILTYINESVNEDLILPSTVRLSFGEGYENLTDYELEPLDENGKECYFVTIDDGKIVSVCEMNTDGVFIGATEINVFTSDGYKKKGYGASNVSAMCKYLSSLGERIAYTVQAENEASIALARKCGFKRIAKTYYYICYRKD